LFFNGSIILVGVIILGGAYIGDIAEMPTWFNYATLALAVFFFILSSLIAVRYKEIPRLWGPSLKGPWVVFPGYFGVIGGSLFEIIILYNMIIIIFR
jgi:hypothetical protein